MIDRAEFALGCGLLLAGFAVWFAGESLAMRPLAAAGMALAGLCFVVMLRQNLRKGEIKVNHAVYRRNEQPVRFRIALAMGCVMLVFWYLGAGFYALGIGAD